MRRVVMALLGTAIGTTLLVGLKAQGAPTDVPVAQAPFDPAAGTGSPDGTTAPTVPAAPSGTATSTAPRDPKPPEAATTTTAAAPASRTILGDPVRTLWKDKNYGTTQVKIVVTGTHIDDIIAVKEGSRPKSTARVLRERALAAQSADVGNVSGATASSIAYKESLQSAIDQI